MLLLVTGLLIWFAVAGLQSAFENPSSPTSTSSLYGNAYDAILDNNRASDQMMAVWLSLGVIDRAANYGATSADTGSKPELSLALAEQHLWAGRYSDVVDTLRPLLSTDPYNTEMHRILGLVLLPGNPSEAVQHLEQAAGTETERALHRQLTATIVSDGFEAAQAMEIGRILASYNLWPFAENAFRHATAIGARTEAMAFTDLMRALQDKSSGELIATALAEDGDDIPIRLIEGIILRLKGDYQGSIQSLLAVLVDDPGNVAIHTELATTYQANGEEAEAIYWLLSAAGLTGEELTINEARVRLDRPEVQNWLAGLEYETISRNIPHIVGASSWAKHLLGMNNIPDELQTAINDSPQDPRLLLDRARIRMANGQLLEAEHDLKMALLTSNGWGELAAQLLATLAVSQ